MPRPFVKVCGITRAEDAAAAVAAGADAVGFVFAPDSPRRISPARAAEIGRALPERVARIGVTVDLSPESMRALAEAAGLTAIQAHGEEPETVCRAYPLPTVKAIPGAADLQELEAYRTRPVLLDGRAPGRRGGTGRPADWELARRAGEAGFRILLAGGLGPENLMDAIRAARPAAVDLNSGVESAPGRKDPDRLRRALELLAGLEPPEESAWPW